MMNRTRATVLILALAAACPAFPAAPGEGAPDLLAAGPLPPPPRSGGISLVEAIWSRRSVRKFSERPPAREELAFVLWAACGVNRPGEGRRTVPSAWGTNVVSLYVVTKDGAALYDPIAHALKPVEGSRGKDLRAQMAGAEFTRTAPVVLVLAADFEKYAKRAAPDVLREMANADCGAIAQDVYLAAAALGLGTVMTADAKAEAKAALGLGPEGRAMYTMPLGHPAEEPATPKGEEKK